MTLARWLGPWAGAGVPDRSGRGGGRVMLLPGLHHLGVEDPRFVRFARIMGAAGAEVWPADLRALRELTLSPAMFDEAERVLVEASQEGPVGLMSVSFGSIVALNLAARHPEKVRRLVMFGPYCDLDATLAYTLGARGDGGGDPLNAPAVFIQLAESLLPEPAERGRFIEAARAFCAETWTSGRGGAADDKHDGRHLAVGGRIADGLSGQAAALLRLACRLDGDPRPLALEALAASRERFRYLDPRPLLGRIRCPVDCVHGRDDDVIPASESLALCARLADARAHLTGWYGHTGARGEGATGIVATAQEALTMGRILFALERLASRE